MVQKAGEQVLQSLIATLFCGSLALMLISHVIRLGRLKTSLIGTVLSCGIMILGVVLLAFIFKGMTDIILKETLVVRTRLDIVVRAARMTLVYLVVCISATVIQTYVDKGANNFRDIFKR